MKSKIENMLQPTIQYTHERKLIGARVTMCLSINKTSELWRRFLLNRKYISHPLSEEVISMALYPKDYFTRFEATKQFDKWAAVEVSQLEAVPPGLETFVLPAGRYAVFDYKGPSNDPSIFQYIFSTWLPASPYILDDRPHFEVLGEKYRNNDPASEEQIWIPVKA